MVHPVREMVLHGEVRAAHGLLWREGEILTYHVVCPISKKRYDFESKDDLRWFTVKILGHLKGTKTQRIRLYDGRTYIGSMWRSAGTIYYQSKGVRAKRIVNERDGTIRRQS